jgi:hypothetical protein
MMTPVMHVVDIDTFGDNQQNTVVNYRPVHKCAGAVFATA